MSTHDDDLIDNEEKATAEECPNCGSPIAWEDVCSECGHALDEEASADNEAVLEDDLAGDRDADYDLEELERDDYEIDEMNEMESDPFTEDEDEEEF